MGMVCACAGGRGEWEVEPIMSVGFIGALVAAAVLMQCCGVLFAARPLDGDVAGGQCRPPAAAAALGTCKNNKYKQDPKLLDETSASGGEKVELKAGDESGDCSSSYAR
uniref:Uncharacterized protein n=1 Tax=Oryza punctata TaxID=4537 RepID=A0A0E0K964_ORYPU